MLIKIIHRNSANPITLVQCGIDNPVDLIPNTSPSRRLGVGWGVGGDKFLHIILHC